MFFSNKACLAFVINVIFKKNVAVYSLQLFLILDWGLVEFLNLSISPDVGLAQSCTAHCTSHHSAPPHVSTN